MEPAIEVRNASKRFMLDNIEGVGGDCRLDGKTGAFRVLTDISLIVPKGQCLGVLGRNGSGKTTLLRLLAGILTPDTGSVTCHGKALPLIELGTGFDEDLSGIENISLYGTLLGMSRRDICERLPSIVEYSGLGDFINMKLKRYSQGMRLRLAFATMSSTEADILLVDEVLSVGDHSFQRKSAAQFERFKREGRTLVVVSHSVSHLRAFCDRVILLDGGRLVADGEPAEVGSAYIKGVLESDYHRLKAILSGSINPSPRQSPWGGWRKRLFGIGRIHASGFTNSTPRNQGILAAAEEFEEMARERLDLVQHEIRGLEELSGQSARPSAGDHEVLGSHPGLLGEKIALRTDIMNDYYRAISLRLKYCPTEEISEVGGALERTLIGMMKESHDATQQLFCLRELGRFGLEQYSSEKNHERRAQRVAHLSRNIFQDKWRLLDAPEQRRAVLSEYLDAFLRTTEGECDSLVQHALLEHIFGFLHFYVFPSRDVEFVLHCVARLASLATPPARVEDPEAFVERLASVLREQLRAHEGELVQQRVGSPEYLRKEHAKRKIVQALLEVYRPVSSVRHERKGWGTGEVVIPVLEAFGTGGEIRTLFQTGERVCFRMHYRASQRIFRPVFGIAIHDERGLLVCGPNSQGMSPEYIEGEGHIDAVFPEFPLLSGRYLLSAAVYNAGGTIPYDHHYQALAFRVVTDSAAAGGIVRIPCNWEHKATSQPLSSQI